MSSSSFNERGEHLGELDTYKHIANWANSEVPFSVTDGFYRYGILANLAYIFLLGLPDTHILEIGAGESSIYLSEVCRRLNRNFYTCDIANSKITNPMSISGYLLEGLHIVTRGSVSSDSKFRGIAYIGASDDLFKDERVKLPPIGFAYIDGDHNYAQAKKDFDNIFEILVPDGVICLHDTYPPNEEYTSEHRCGDVYRLRQELEKRTDLDCFTFTKTVGVEVGITMIRKKSLNRVYYHE